MDPSGARLQIQNNSKQHVNITPRLCVRARVNIAQPQNPGANAPNLKNYVKLAQKSFKIGLTYFDILPIEDILAGQSDDFEKNLS